MFLSLLLVSACSSIPTQKAASTSGTSAIDPFPAATAGIQVAGGEGPDGMKLPKLLEEFSKVTSVALLMDPETRGDVAKCSTGLNRNVDVPASEVYSVVETILLQHGFYLVPAHDRDPRIATLVSINQGGRGQNPRTSAVLVTTNDLEFYTRHPAVVVTTVVDLPHTDVRTLSNSMRAMFTDASTQQIIPVGNTNTLIVTGFAGSVKNIVRMLQLAEESSVRAIAEDEKRRADQDARRANPPVPAKDAQPRDEKPKQ